LTRVFLTRPLPERVVAAAEQHFEVEVRQKTIPMKAAEMRAALALYDGVLPTLGDVFTADIFGSSDAHRCKILANFGVGCNHIDVTAAGDANIAVTNTPGAVTDATADIAMTLMLMSARRAAEGERLIRSRKWEGWHPTQMLGMHLSGKTVGIVGMGRIGQAVAKRCHFGFGMNVIYFTRSEKDIGFPSERVGSLKELAGLADVVVAAVPGGADTRHMIGTEFFKSMKTTGHFVNIARGEIVKEAALIAALQGGRIAGAGLDVYEREPKIPDELIALDNVTMLPHLGTSALEVRESMGLMAVENLKAFFEGEAPPNLVT